MCIARIWFLLDHGEIVIWSQYDPHLIETGDHDIDRNMIVVRSWYDRGTTLEWSWYHSGMIVVWSWNDRSTILEWSWYDPVMILLDHDKFETENFDRIVEWVRSQNWSFNVDIYFMIIYLSMISWQDRDRIAAWLLHDRGNSDCLRMTNRKWYYCIDSLLQFRMFIYFQLGLHMREPRSEI